MKKDSKSIRLIPIILSLMLAMAVGLSGCVTINPPAATPTPNPAPAPEPTWSPDSSKVIVYSRHELEQGVIVPIPQGDMRIVPFEIGQEERIQTFSLTAISGGGFQSFVRDSKGNFVLESPLAPWQAEAYYLHIRNESPTSEYCKVKLTIRFMAQSITPTGALTPAPPEVPQEVLSIWKSEPASAAYPADISGKVTLEPNKASERGGVSEGDIKISVIATKGSWEDSLNFYLCEGQWIDVIASSIDTPIYYLSEEPEAVSLKSVYWHKEDDKIVRSTYSQDMGIFTPFYGKLLYENRITNTGGGTVSTTGVRLFAWGGAGNYCVTFYNFSSQKGCEITYRIYKQDTTPGWGKAYKEAKLQPWLNDLYHLHVSGKITQEEYDKAESQWLKQFE